jgi:hypothetical protein
MQSYRDVFSTELSLEDVADPWKRRLSAPALTTRGIESYEQLLKVLHEGGYQFFIYDKTAGRQLYPKLESLLYPDSRPQGLTPIYVPESGEFAAYRVLQNDAPTVRRLDVTLNGGIKLIGYESHVSQDQPRGSSSSLGVYLYWQTVQPLNESLKVFVHVLNSQGQLVAQDDSVPAVWTRPTQTWQPGETIVDFHQVRMGAEVQPGEYTVQVGLYDEETDTRVQRVDAAGNPIADTIVLSKINIK